jgi:hypothetical protein
VEAVADGFVVGWVFLEVKAEFSGEAEGPLVVEGSDEDGGLSAQVGEGGGSPGAQFHRLSALVEHAVELHQGTDIGESYIAIEGGDEVRERDGSRAGEGGIVEELVEIAGEFEGVSLADAKDHGTGTFEQGFPKQVQVTGIAGLGRQQSEGEGEGRG